jgi:hypothetical protein
MHEKHHRSLVVLITVVVFLPTWIVAMFAYHHGLISLESYFETTISLWLKNTGSFVLLGLILIMLTRCAAGWLNQRYPDSRPRSADWRDAT